MKGWAMTLLNLSPVLFLLGFLFMSDFLLDRPWILIVFVLAPCCSLVFTGSHAGQFEASNTEIEPNAAKGGEAPPSTKTLFIGGLPLPLLILVVLTWQEFSRYSDNSIGVHLYNMVMFLGFTATWYLVGVFTLWVFGKVESNGGGEGRQ